MFVTGLADVLRAAGLTVVEVGDWKTNGYTPPETGVTQELAAYAGNLWHHTATGRAAFDRSNAPTLDMCVNGRPDLPGPLCNGVLGRDGTVYLIAAGKANHAGRGSAAGIPTDAGNYYLVGWEMESSGVAPWDWTPEQLDAAPRIAAATERAYGFELELGHLEYSSEGKIDPAGWPGGMDGFRDTVNGILAGTIQVESAAAPAAPTVEDDEMLVIYRDTAAKDPGKVWIGNGITRRHVADPKQLADLQKMAAQGLLNIFDGGKVQTLPTDLFGVDVTAAGK